MSCIWQRATAILGGWDLPLRVWRMSSKYAKGLLHFLKIGISLKKIMVIYDIGGVVFFGVFLIAIKKWRNLIRMRVLCCQLMIFLLMLLSFYKILCGQHTPSTGFCIPEENAISGLSSILILEQNKKEDFR